MSNPLGNIEVIATNDMFCDPAIDLSDPENVDDEAVLSAEDMLEKYRRTREVSDLRLKSDPKPVMFVCKPIKAVFVAAVLENMTPNVRHMFAFLAACHEIKIPNEPTLKPKKLKPMAHAQTIAEDDWIQLVSDCFGLETVYEIGSVIYERSRLGGAAKATFRSGWMVR